MKKHNLKFNLVKRPMVFATAVLMSAAFVSCEKDDDGGSEDEGEELITTVELTVVNVEDQSTSTYRWRDLDGPGGNDPVIDDISFTDNTSYGYTLRFLNESEEPAEDITEEIREEDDEHLVCLSSTSNVTIVRADRDDNELEVGLVGTISTSSSVNGNLNIVLRHQPGVKDGTCEPGDTDIDVIFPVSIN